MPTTMTELVITSCIELCGSRRSSSFTSILKVFVISKFLTRVKDLKSFNLPFNFLTKHI